MVMAMLRRGNNYMLQIKTRVSNGTKMTNTAGDGDDVPQEEDCDEEAEAGDVGLRALGLGFGD